MNSYWPEQCLWLRQQAGDHHGWGNIYNHEIMPLLPPHQYQYHHHHHQYRYYCHITNTSTIIVFVISKSIFLDNMKHWEFQLILLYLKRVTLHSRTGKSWKSLMSSRNYKFAKMYRRFFHNLFPNVKRPLPHVLTECNWGFG